MFNHIKLVSFLTAAVVALGFSPLRAAEQSTQPESKAAGTKSTTTREGSGEKSINSEPKVDLNSASQDQLQTLPGVGPSTAKNIINARPFKNVNELTNVSGISSTRFATIKPLVTVKPARNSDIGKPGGNEKGSATSHSSSSESGKAGAEERSTATPRSTTTQDAGNSSRIDHNTAPAKTTPPTSSRVGGQRVNLNTASKEQLESLPGIGPVRAQSIIDGRPYSKPEDVMKVNGIKEGIYDEIKDLVIVK